MNHSLYYTNNRGNPCAVNRVHTAKLTPEKVQDIRKRWRLGQNTQTQLSIEYGVSDATINKIVKRETWRNVP